MPLLTVGDFSGAISTLDSSSYSETTAQSIGGIGLAKQAYQVMTSIVNSKRADLATLEKTIQNSFVALNSPGWRAPDPREWQSSGQRGVGRHYPFQAGQGGPDQGSLSLHLQQRAVLQANLVDEFHQRVRFALERLRH